MRRLFTGVAEGMIQGIGQASGEQLQTVDQTEARRGHRPGARRENDHGDRVGDSFTMAARSGGANRQKHRL